MKVVAKVSDYVKKMKIFHPAYATQINNVQTPNKTTSQFPCNVLPTNSVSFEVLF